MDNLDWTFDEEKREWIDKDGTRYSEDKKVLKQCPCDYMGYFGIPSSVTNIGEMAFRGCSSLSEIIQVSQVPNLPVLIDKVQRND